MEFENEVAPLENDEVTKHTASLWKYIAPPPEPEAYAEYRQKEIETGKSLVFGATVRGKKHKHDGSNCDDYFEIGKANDWVIICVSDGAGSKPLSRIGASSSCKVALSYYEKELLALSANVAFNASLKLDLSSPRFNNACQKLTDILQKGVILAHEAVNNEFEERKDTETYKKAFPGGINLRDFSATLLCAILIPIIINEETVHLTLTCQVGDGMLASFDVNQPYDKVLRLLGAPDSGEFVGETEFLTSPKMKNQETLMSRTKVARSKLSHFMVMTDGVSDDYFPNDPQLIRLYLDLLVNGIIDFNENCINDYTDINETIKNFPPPSLYPWVNNPSIMIALNYVNKISLHTGMSVEELFNKKQLLEFFSKNIDFDGLDAVKKLSYWLDNYVERGSFDDRTLVIFKSI